MSIRDLCKNSRYYRGNHKDIAEVLFNIARYGGEEPRVGLNLVVSGFIDMFKEDNPAFNADKFRSMVYGTENPNARKP